MTDVYTLSYRKGGEWHVHGHNDLPGAQAAGAVAFANGAVRVWIWEPTRVDSQGRPQSQIRYMPVRRDGGVEWVRTLSLRPGDAFLKQIGKAPADG